MFSQRKRFYQRKSFYGIVLAFLLAFGFWINSDPGSEGGGGVKEPVVNTGEQVPSTGSQGKTSDKDNNQGIVDSANNPNSGYNNGSGGYNNGSYGDGANGGYGNTDGYGSNNGYGSDYYTGNNDPSGQYGGDLYGDEDGYPNEPDANTNADVNGGSDALGQSDLTAPYYLLKEDGGYIKLYTVTESGKKQLIRTTEISFSLLSESDQELFKKGIAKQTKDELSDLLQDFES